MCAREAVEGAHQRAVVVDRPRNLIVKAFVTLTFDSVDAEWDPLADQYPGAGWTVIVGEVNPWHRYWKLGRKRQRREFHLGFHLGPTAVADRVVEVAGELHEQLGVQIGLR